MRIFGILFSIFFLQFLISGCLGGVETTPPRTEPPIPTSQTSTPEASDAQLPSQPMQSPTTQNPAAPMTEETEPAVVSTPEDYPGFESLIQQVKNDLAEQLKVEATAIEVKAFEAVVWPDGSLGCPQPGMAYAQVRREGYRIHLRYGEHLYTYHGGEGQAPFLCLLKSTPPSLSPLP